MEYTKVKYIFLFILIVEFTAIYKGKKFYPSIIFPAFENKLDDLDDYRKVKIIDTETNKEIDIVNIIKPYDKYYYLSSIRAIAMHPEETGAINFLLFLSNKDSLNFIAEVIKDEGI